ncbi:hypothetical protein AJ80_02291 [Polytolypa hystricis UAMH7299]|uniref:Aminotransferase class V domain-containing protein n=1 Tax=Polytolypa hystricis (strain UAMH7299) TaxID=1447883 RepID=A0A2B7YQU0_POLH7|nr:hypothetical protein AJ80_02291 [Polytolypa hystricis UAMH7299]
MGSSLSCVNAPHESEYEEEPWGKPKKRGDTLREAERLFRKANPDYNTTEQLDHLRAVDYPTLDKDGHVYLDYTGSGLYAESQLRKHSELLRRNVFGNPHSLNPTSSAITALGEEARNMVLRFFKASPDEYDVIFTPNASHALKLVAESYPFTSNSEVLLLSDNHNSVHGIREFARVKGAAISYVPVLMPDLRADEVMISMALNKKPSERNDAFRLFAYPAQSNFTGVQHPLEWIAKAQSQGWHVLLDAAAFVPTNQLDLSRWHPDFVPVSFYKMFGYPTGAGCLIVRKAALSLMNRPWFAGGTVWGASVVADDHVLLEGHEAFEDGTINFLNLPAVHIGLNHLKSIGMETIHERVSCLTDWLLKTLFSLHHANGNPLLIIYGPPDIRQRGGTISFNFLTPKGNVVDERIVETRASAIRISLRTGCFCNSGPAEAAWNLSKEALHRAFNAKNAEKEYGREIMKEDFIKEIGMPSGGAVRISVGLMSNFVDAYRFVEFARTFLDNFPSHDGLMPRQGC